MSDNTKPMAAVGTFDTVLPFRAVGVDTFATDGEESVETTLKRLAREGYGVVFVEESVYVSHSALIDELNLEYSTSILPIPGISGSLGTGLRAMRASVERAVGMDIFAVK